jgi:hypothetical protein
MALQAMLITERILRKTHPETARRILSTAKKITAVDPELSLKLSVLALQLGQEAGLVPSLHLVMDVRKIFQEVFNSGHSMDATYVISTVALVRKTSKELFEQYDNYVYDLMKILAQMFSRWSVAECVRAETSVHHHLLCDGNSLLHLVCGQYRGSEETRKEMATIARLLLACGADPDLKDEEGNTALHLAAKNRSSEVIDVLLEAGADPRVANSNGRTYMELMKLSVQGRSWTRGKVASLELLAVRALRRKGAESYGPALAAKHLNEFYFKSSPTMRILLWREKN